MSEPPIDEQITSALDNTAPWAIHAIRVDERRRLAKLLEDNAKTIAWRTKSTPRWFRGDAEQVIKDVALLIGLENGGVT